MTEKEIRDKIKEKLETEFTDFNVNDFPVNLYDYMPVHPKGELLIKSLGYRLNYIMRNRTGDPADWGDLAITEYQYKIDIILRELRTQEEIFELTETLINKISETDIVNCRLYLTDCSEADYDEEKMFQFRTLIFTIPYFGLT